MSKELSTPKQQLPAHLQPVQTGEIAGLQKDDRVRPSFLKVVQPQSKPPLADKFSPGDIVLLPQMLKVAGKDEPFNFVPLFQYFQYCIHNPIQVSGLPFIREKSLDPDSAIAKRATAMNPKAREAPCPESPDHKLHYVEHINLVISLLDHNDGIGSKPIVASWFKAEWKHGMNALDLIRGRAITPICGNQLQAVSTRHMNDLGSWYGVEVMNPTDVSPFVEEEERFRQYEEMSKALNEMYSSRDLDVDYEVPEAAESEF